MERLVTSHLKLGIIAGGQLGKMLVQEASKWDISTFVLDREKDCPAGSIATVFQQGDPLSFDDVYNFGKKVETLTFEIENINVEALHRLKAEGVKVIPDPATLEMIQDKGLQKEFYEKHNIPTAPFQLVKSKEEVHALIADGTIDFPFVQKLRKGGYDGRGVSVIDKVDQVSEIMEGPSVIEEKVAIDKEIAVIVARNAKEEVRCFPAVEMVFDSRANLVEKLVCPSAISQELAMEAENIATRLIKSLDMVGLLAVEFFLDKSGKLIVNEVAPRPHNSGHHTIESVITSQFEQHLRAILNLPLGSTHLKMPAVMLNILGEPGHEGKVTYEGLTESMSIEGVKIHVYGKVATRPMRKMGHVTVMSGKLEDAIEKAEQVKQLIKVKSWKTN